mgnify:CR=1 FL=1
MLIQNKLKVGYVPMSQVVHIDHQVKDWVAMAEQLLGTPYRWGGRDTIGIDCSTLLSLHVISSKGDNVRCLGLFLSESLFFNSSYKANARSQASFVIVLLFLPLLFNFLYYKNKKKISDYQIF